MIMNKNTRLAADQKLLAGVQKHFGSAPSLIVGGKTYTLEQIVELLQSRVDAASAVPPARAAWQNVLALERERLAETKAFVDALKQTILVTFGSAVDVLADFGVSQRKPPRELSGDEQA